MRVPIATIYVLGCHHALQSVQVDSRWLVWKDSLARLGRDVVAIANEHKASFARRIAEICDSYEIDFIGEEAQPGMITHASQVGRQYQMIDMPPEERDKRGIPLDYAGNSTYSQENRARWDAERERYMFEQVQENRGKAESLLIICGSNHLTTLARMFEHNGDEVRTEDVTKAPWFDSFVSKFC